MKVKINVSIHFTNNAHLLLSILFSLVALQVTSQVNSSYTYTSEFHLGITTPSNSNFVDRDLQKQIFLRVDRSSKSSSHFMDLRSGIGIGVTDFGNSRKLGYAFTLMPYLEFPVFNSQKLFLFTGVGTSYFTEKYDVVTNFNNRAVSTDFTWSARASISYQVLTLRNVNFTIGAGIFHHSNGHLKLPNNGYNSFLLSVGSSFSSSNTKDITTKRIPSNTLSNPLFIESRFGLGANVFNDGFPFNTAKAVHTISLEVGKLYRQHYKISLGGFYRFYKHYYDYISNNESLVQEGKEFESLKSNAYWNASNIGLFIKSEMLFNHLGIELQIGVNIHKPAYKIDWRINEGWDFAPRDIPEPPSWELGEFGSKYKLKQRINGRFGVKYYLKDLQTTPKNNWFAGIYLNTNLGQADFTELAIGHSFLLD